MGESEKVTDDGDKDNIMYMVWNIMSVVGEKGNVSGGVGRSNA